MGRIEWSGLAITSGGSTLVKPLHEPAVLQIHQGFPSAAIDCSVVEYGVFNAASYT
jgi:hypothetical protein